MSGCLLCETGWPTMYEGDRVCGSCGAEWGSIEIESETKMEKSCWNCGHWLIGLGCCASGIDTYKKTDPDHSCDKWVNEGTTGSVTDYDEMNDGDAWAENEYLKDDESNL